MRAGIRPFGRSEAFVAPFRALSANERQLLSLLRHDAPLSRAELARRTGLALPTVSRLADGLMRDGLLAAEKKVMMGKMGQPSLPLIIAEHAAYAFGVSVRADSLSVRLVHLAGALVAEWEEALAGTARDHVIARILELLETLATSAGIPHDRVCGVGLALSGFFVDDPQRIVAPLGMEDWASSALRAQLQDALGLPVIIENDGGAAAYGEFLHGDAPPSFAYLHIDRGLGGGVVIDGQLMRGRRGNAGEFTGLLRPENRPKRPTLELLRRMAAEDGMVFDSISELVSAYDPAWPATERWVAAAADASNDIVSAIGAILDPDAIILGGRIPGALADRLARAIHFHTVPVRGAERAFPTVRASAIQADAAALGAAALCFGQHFL